MKNDNYNDTNDYENKKDNDNDSDMILYDMI